jgi:hypothetical protein
LLITLSVLFYQNKLKFRVTIDKSQQETVIKKVVEDFRKYKEFKKKQVFWQEKAKKIRIKDFRKEKESHVFLQRQ